MIIKLTITNVSTIVRDSESKKPEGINQYVFAGKLKKAEIVEILNSATISDPILGTFETLDSIAYEKVDVDLTPPMLASDASIKTGIISGPYLPADNEDVNAHSDSVCESEER